jgi:hypothetical protein
MKLYNLFSVAHKIISRLISFRTIGVINRIVKLTRLKNTNGSIRMRITSV